MKSCSDRVRFYVALLLFTCSYKIVFYWNTSETYKAPPSPFAELVFQKFNWNLKQAVYAGKIKYLTYFLCQI